MKAYLENFIFLAVIILYNITFNYIYKEHHTIDDNKDGTGNLMTIVSHSMLIGVGTKKGTYSVSDHFLIPDPTDEKWNANLLFFCFLCFQEQSLSLSHSQKDPESGKKSSRIPVKKKHRIQDPERWLGSLASRFPLSNPECREIFMLPVGV
jgi:hypothetical protein